MTDIDLAQKRMIFEEATSVIAAQAILLAQMLTAEGTEISGPEALEAFAAQILTTNARAFQRGTLQ